MLKTKAAINILKMTQKNNWDFYIYIYSYFIIILFILFDSSCRYENVWLQTDRIIIYNSPYKIIFNDVLM